MPVQDAAFDTAIAEETRHQAHDHFSGAVHQSPGDIDQILADGQLRPLIVILPNLLRRHIRLIVADDLVAPFGKQHPLAVFLLCR